MGSFRVALPASVVVSITAENEEEAIKKGRELMLRTADGFALKNNEHAIMDARCWFQDDKDVVVEEFEDGEGVPEFQELIRYWESLESREP